MYREPAPRLTLHRSRRRFAERSHPVATDLFRNFSTLQSKYELHSIKTVRTNISDDGFQNNALFIFCVNQVWHTPGRITVESHENIHLPIKETIKARNMETNDTIP